MLVMQLEDEKNSNTMSTKEIQGDQALQAIRRDYPGLTGDQFMVFFGQELNLMMFALLCAVGSGHFGLASSLCYEPKKNWLSMLRNLFMPSFEVSRLRC
jgi:hypothetical protein